MRGTGRGINAILERVVETPWLAYLFLLVMLYFLLSTMIERKKLFGPVQIIIAICMSIVYNLRTVQGHGTDYAMIWVLGIIGILTYWIDLAIRNSWSPGIPDD